MSVIGVTGARGRLGSALVARYNLAPLDADITDLDSVQEALDAVQPDIIINCASYTKVDRAEDEMDAAYAANVRGVSNLCRFFQGHFVHISSGFVFSGEQGAYSEEDEAGECANHYAYTKWAAELVVEDFARGSFLIVRTLDLFAPDSRPDFVKAMRAILEKGKPYHLPSHLYGNPSYVPAVAQAIMESILQGVTGKLHICGETILSRFEWGRMIAAHFGLDVDLIQPTDIIKGVDRPLNASLRVERAKSLGLPILTAQEGLERLTADENSTDSD